MEEGVRDSEGMIGMLCVQVGRITVFSSGMRPVCPGVKGERLVPDLGPLGLSRFSLDADRSVESLPQAVDRHPVWLAPSLCRRAQGKCFYMPFWFVVLP